MASYSTYQLRIEGPEDQRVYPLPRGEIVIGYDPDSDLFLNDRAISGKHARIAYTSDGFTVTDLESDNGTFWQGDRRDPNSSWDRLNPKLPLSLRIGESLKIGSYELIFEAQSLPYDRTAVEDITTSIARHPLRLYPYTSEVPPGLSRYSLALLPYLPAIYQPEKALDADWDPLDAPGDFSEATFLARFLALFESVLLPIEWLIGNFDFYLDAQTAPADFFGWLESWYGLPLVANLGVEQRRQLLLHAYELYNLKGSRTALAQVIELCTGCTPTIDDLTTPDASFRVEVPSPANQPVDRTLVEQLIVAFKPVHTSYELKITTGAPIEQVRLSTEGAPIEQVRR